jgi:hypothetical protein
LSKFEGNAVKNNKTPLHRFLLNKNFSYFVLFLSLLFLGFFVYKVYGLTLEDLSLTRIKGLFLSAGLVLVMIALLAVQLGQEELRNYYRMKTVQEQQKWTINAINFHLDAIYKKIRLERPNENLEPDESSQRWPWGSHHTENLAHLEAAANRYWKLYDEKDITTAPTNDMVAEWLHNERGVSKDKAKAIASILRADGLPTGRRG